MVDRLEPRRHIRRQRQSLLADALRGRAGGRIEAIEQRCAASVEFLHQLGAPRDDSLVERAEMRRHFGRQRGGLVAEALRRGAGLRLELVEQRSPALVELLHEFRALDADDMVDRLEPGADVAGKTRGAFADAGGRGGRGGVEFLGQRDARARRDVRRIRRPLWR